MDLALKQDQETGIFDLYIKNGDLATSGGLYEDVVISLFSNERAGVNEIVESTNRFGWWANSLLPDSKKKIFSKLYQLSRAKITIDRVDWTEKIMYDSLKHLIDDGVASDVVVNAIRNGLHDINVSIEIYQPTGIETFNFQFAWDDL